MSFNFRCLYCAEEKAGSESSLEHAIPQFLGGDAAPKKFHLTNVCRTCNNRLGLFVDASYAKSWLVTNALSEAARLLCTGKSDPGLPLRCLGIAEIPNLSVPEGYVAEYWLGPFSESMIWIRSHDERMQTYTGGNPIDSKKKPSTAYWFVGPATAVTLELGIRSLMRAMEKRQARKLLGAEVRDGTGATVNPHQLGFDMPSQDESKNLEAIRAAIESGTIPARISLNTKFDQRFICKMVLGVGCALFGDSFLNDRASEEARQGVWPKKDGPLPVVRGTSTLRINDPQFATIAGYKSAVVLTVMKSGDIWALAMTIDERLPFIVQIGPATMASSHINAEEGYSLLLFPYLDQAVEVTTAALLAHRLGVLKHPALQVIDERLRASEVFDQTLPALQLPFDPPAA